MIIKGRGTLLFDVGFVVGIAAGVVAGCVQQLSQEQAAMKSQSMIGQFLS